MQTIKVQLFRGMQRFKFMFLAFLQEPLWFRVVISTALIVSLIFSSSFLSDNPYYQSISKLAAAVIFIAYGYKMRRNRRISLIFFGLAGLCIYLSIIV